MTTIQSLQHEAVKELREMKNELVNTTLREWLITFWLIFSVMICPILGIVAVFVAYSYADYDDLKTVLYVTPTAILFISPCLFTIYKLVLSSPDEGK